MVDKISYPEFEDIEISTITAQVYFNGKIDVVRMFETINVDEKYLESQFTYEKDKDGFIEKTTIKGPDNTVFCVRFFSKHKGLDVRKRKKKTDVCGNTIITITNFRNQITLDFLFKGKIVNIMLFNSNFKIAGAKSPNDIAPITNFIMEFLFPYKNFFIEKQETLEFIYVITMKNIKSCFNFTINKDNLATALSKDENYLKLFNFDKEQTNIKISFNYTNLQGMFDNIVFKDYFSSDVFKEGVIGLTSKAPKEKLAGTNIRTVTLTIFSSSQCILSGKINNLNKLTYEFIVDFIKKNYENIREREVGELKPINFLNDIINFDYNQLICINLLVNN